MIFCIIKYDRLPTTTVPPSAGFPTVSKAINIVQINSVANESIYINFFKIVRYTYQVNFSVKFYRGFKNHKKIENLNTFFFRKNGKRCRDRH